LGDAGATICAADSGWQFSFSQTIPEVDQMVSVVVSIRRRKMFAQVRRMFLNARHAEQDVRERQAGRNF
jgi:hypothetical protein